MADAPRCPQRLLFSPPRSPPPIYSTEAAVQSSSRKAFLGDRLPPGKGGQASNTFFLFFLSWIPPWTLTCSQRQRGGAGGAQPDVGAECLVPSCGFLAATRCAPKSPKSTKASGDGGRGRGGGIGLAWGGSVRWSPHRS